MVIYDVRQVIGGELVCAFVEHFVVEDGGIDDQSISQAKEAGANVFVAGSYVFNGDVNERVQTLRDAVNG